jgi:putative transposase
MARAARVDVGGQIYHVINRAVGRLQIFNTDEDYLTFLNILREAGDTSAVKVLAYCCMPNHWHLMLRTNADGDLGKYMHWLTNAHTRFVHTKTQTVGTGPLYQGRYKSFLVDDDIHLKTVVKYVERNAVRANLVAKPEDWKWGSAWLRMYGNDKQTKLLAELPFAIENNYFDWLNTIDTEKELEQMRNSVKRGVPYGRDRWVDAMVQKYGLESTVRTKGRPKKE